MDRVTFEFSLPLLLYLSLSLSFHPLPVHTHLMYFMAVTLLQATFTYPMAGVIYFKQVGAEDVSIWGKLYWVNNAQRTVNHMWSITQTAVSMSTLSHDSYDGSV